MSKVFCRFCGTAHDPPSCIEQPLRYRNSSADRLAAAGAKVEFEAARQRMLLLPSSLDYFKALLAADPTLAADLALAAAVRRHDAHLFTVDSLAAALQDDFPRWADPYTQARAIIKAAKEASE